MYTNKDKEAQPSKVVPIQNSTEKVKVKDFDKTHFIAQRKIDILFAKLMQSEDEEEMMDILGTLFEEISEDDFTLNHIQIHTIIQLFDDSFCQSDEVRVFASQVISAIIHSKPEKYVDIFVSKGIMEVVAAFFPGDYEIEDFLPDLLYTSFYACKEFVENGLLPKLMEVLSEIPLNANDLTRCVEALSHYSAFEGELVPFVPLLFEIACKEEYDEEKFTSCLDALGTMATFSGVLASSIVADPRCFQVIEMVKESLLENSLVVDSFIRFIGGLLSRQGLLPEENFVELATILFEYLKGEDQDFRKISVKGLIKACVNGPPFVQLCIESETLLCAAEIFYTFSGSIKDKKLFLEFIFNAFLNAALEQAEYFVNEPISLINLIVEASNSLFDELSSEIINSLTKLIEIASETSKDDWIEAIIENDEINEMLEAFIDSQDQDLALKASALKDVIEKC